MTSPEEVTIIKTQSPAQILTQTTKTSQPGQPPAKGELPQIVYEKKKTILRFTQIIWYISGFIEVLLIFRVILKALGANPYIGFTNLIYTITSPLAAPFAGILGISATGYSILEWSTIIAGIVYLCITWGFVYLLELVYPITPRDLETE